MSPATPPKAGCAHGSGSGGEGAGVRHPGLWSQAHGNNDCSGTCCTADRHIWRQTNLAFASPKKHGTLLLPPRFPRRNGKPPQRCYRMQQDPSRPLGDHTPRQHFVLCTTYLSPFHHASVCAAFVSQLFYMSAWTKPRQRKSPQTRVPRQSCCSQADMQAPCPARTRYSARRAHREVLRATRLEVFICGPLFSRPRGCGS
jgi:hypothetical protein